MSDDLQQPPKPVTPEDIWYQLGRNTAKLGEVHRQLKTYHDDHLILDRRVRSLERTRTQLLAGAGVVGTIATLSVGAWVKITNLFS